MAFSAIACRLIPKVPEPSRDAGTRPAAVMAERPARDPQTGCYRRQDRQEWSKKALVSACDANRGRRCIKSAHGPWEVPRRQ